MSEGDIFVLIISWYSLNPASNNNNIVVGGVIRF